LLVLALVGIPFYWLYVLQTFDVSTDNAITAQVRAQAASQEVGGAFEVVRNLPLLAIFVAYGAFHRFNWSRSSAWRVIIAFSLAIAYMLATGTKGALVTLPLALLFIVGVRERHVDWRLAAILLVIVILGFSSGVILVNFAYQEFGELTALLHALMVTFQNYWLGSLVAFDRVVTDPSSVAATQEVSRFYYETTKSLGADIDISMRHAEYTSIGPDQNTNTYTIYFSYFPSFGWWGTLACMGLLGAVLGLVYRWSTQRSQVAQILYGTLCVGLVLSVRSESFVLALNTHVKLVVFLAAVYLIPSLVGGRIPAPTGER